MLETPVARVLAELRREHPRLGEQATAAVDWLSADGPFELSQSRLQQFLWYELPQKWIVPPREQARLLKEVRDGLAWVLARLGRERYAFICRSAITESVHTAYLRSARDGLQACKRAIAGSGIDPPDLDAFRWGGLMGLEEADARDRVADTLEAAVAGGELPVGARGWRTRQRQLATAALDQPHPNHPGLSWLEVVHEERLAHWCEAPEGRELAALRARAAPRVSALIATPEGVDAAFEPLRWFLTAIGDGVRLTATGNLARDFVVDAAQARGWWPDIGTVRSEDDVFELIDLHETALTLRAVRRTGGNLVCTAPGRELMSQPARLWEQFVGILAGPSGFAAAALETLALILLLRRAAGRKWTLLEEVADLLAGEGYRSSADGPAPSADDIAWQLADPLRLLELFNMLVTRGGWDDRQLALTPIGEATLWALLRASATAPLTWERT